MGRRVKDARSLLVAIEDDFQAQIRPDPGVVDNPEITKIAKAQDHNVLPFVRQQIYDIVRQLDKVGL